MQKALTTFIVCLLSAFGFSTVSRAQTDYLQTREFKKQQKHLRILKNKYPYALLRDDFGILNESDLHLNSCFALPSPFSQTSTSYPYWQCIETSKVFFSCDTNGVPDAHEGIQGLMVVTLRSSQNDQGFIARRPEKFVECRKLVEELRALTKNTSHVCILGEFINEKKVAESVKETSWIFDAFKTKRGCLATFYGDCSLKHQIKYGCDL